MEDAENRLITEPALIGTDRLEGQRCKYAEKSYLYKYDLGHSFLCVESCCCAIVKLGVQRVRETERERERERDRCLHCVTAAACGEEEDKRLLPLCSLCHCIPLSYSIFYSLWAVVVFPTLWVLLVIPCVSTLLTIFLTLIWYILPRFGCGRTNY